MRDADKMEEMTIQFLRENDPLFLCKKKNKKMEYPYLTKRQQNLRNKKEVPLSNLTTRQKLKCPKLGDSISFEEAF